MQARLATLVISAVLAALAQTPRPVFEVASVKPASQEHQQFARIFGSMPLSLKLRDPSRLRISGSSLRDIIAAAFSVPAVQVAGPAWMDDARFDIEATIPEGRSSQVAEMLQSLLEERFGLKLHRESRIVPGYELVVAKGGLKMKPAAPRPDDSEMGPAERRQKMEDLAKQLQKRQMANPHTGSWSSWGGPMTMPDLAVALAKRISSPVIDTTELEGEFDFKIETSWGNPDEPDVTIFDAVAKLGLKLESRKVTVETLVIDEVSRIPTEN